MPRALFVQLPITSNFLIVVSNVHTRENQYLFLMYIKSIEALINTLSLSLSLSNWWSFLNFFIMSVQNVCKKVVLVVSKVLEI